MSSKFFVVILFASFSFLGFQDTVAITHRLGIRHTDGQEYELATDHANLPLLTPVAQVCNSGIWTIYQVPNFSNEGVVQILIPHGNCQQPATNTIRSARMVGSQLNNSLPSATFFNRIELAGDILVIDDGVPNLPFPIASFVTINTNLIEFFREVNYKGDSFCVVLSSLGTSWYWNWEEIYNTPWYGGGAMSARLGCNEKSSTIVCPRTSGRSTSRNT